MGAIDCRDGFVVVRMPGSSPCVRGIEAWSGLARSWIRGHGFPVSAADANAPGADGSGSEAFELALGCERPGPRGLAEAPFHGAWLASVGLGGREVAAEWLDIRCQDGLELRGAGFSGDIVRRIPAARGERSDPHPWAASDGLMRVPSLRVQFLEAGPGWESIADARAPDGSEGCVVARRGALTVAGAPLFAIAARYRWMPPLDEGYYSIERRCWGEVADLWLARLVEDSARAAGVILRREAPWPGGARSALTVRFDHDRAIPEESLHSLLALLDAHGLKASWGFLARLSDPAAMHAVARRGHEIVLHTEAGSRERLREELDHFRALGHDVRGVTAHGGIGSAGHLGQRLHEWAAAEGLEHADILSRETHMPHPAIAAGPDGLRELPLMLPPVHCSLDIGTKPDAHALRALLAEVPSRIARGGLVTVMNHPDIHRDQLRELFESVDLPATWRTTHLGAVRRVCQARAGLAAAGT